jgi:hypothetical protein
MRLAFVVAMLSTWPATAAQGDFFLGLFNNFRRYSDGSDQLHHSLSFGEVVGGIAYSPDGLLYVTGNDFGVGYIYRFDPATNTFLDDPSSNIAFAGGILQYTGPGATAFNSSGHLFGIAYEKDPDENVITRDATIRRFRGTIERRSVRRQKRWNDSTAHDRSCRHNARRHVDDWR